MSIPGQFWARMIQASSGLVITSNHLNGSKSIKRTRQRQHRCHLMIQKHFLMQNRRICCRTPKSCRIYYTGTRLQKHKSSVTLKSSLWLPGPRCKPVDIYQGTTHELHSCAYCFEESNPTEPTVCPKETDAKGI